MAQAPQLRPLGPRGAGRTRHVSYHRWRVDDVLMLDERATMYRGADEGRIMLRTIVYPN